MGTEKGTYRHIQINCTYSLLCCIVQLQMKKKMNEITERKDYEYICKQSSDVKID